MQCRKIFVSVILLAFVTMLGGCFSSNPVDIGAFTRPDEALVAKEIYILQPPDEIEIYCSKVPELHLQRQQIRPDGKVTFETLGQVQAAGKTPKQLAEIIGEKAAVLYTLQGENPVDVRVINYESEIYYVLGQVHFPGPKVSGGRDTALSAIATARPTILGWMERVQVIRPSANGDVKAKIFELDYKRMIANGDTSKNVLLQEGDIIYVPPTVLASIAMKVEEFVTPIARAFATVNIVQGQPQYR